MISGSTNKQDFGREERSVSGKMGTDSLSEKADAAEAMTSG